MWIEEKLEIVIRGIYRMRGIFQHVMHSLSHRPRKCLENQADHLLDVFQKLKVSLWHAYTLSKVNTKYISIQYKSIDSWQWAIMLLVFCHWNYSPTKITQFWNLSSIFNPLYTIITSVNILFSLFPWPLFHSQFISFLVKMKQYFYIK